MGLIFKGSLYLGSHLFGLFQTLLTRPGHSEPLFISAGFMDNIQFERFNNRSDFPGMEHCAPWIDHRSPEYWKEHTQRALKDIRFMRQALKLMIHTYNYSATGECVPIRKPKFNALHALNPVLHVQSFPLENVTHDLIEQWD